MVLTLSFLKMLLTPEVSVCRSLSRKLETAQHTNIGTSVRAVFFLLAGHDIRHGHCLCGTSCVSVGHVVYVVSSFIIVHTPIIKVFN